MRSSRTPTDKTSKALSDCVFKFGEDTDCSVKSKDVDISVKTKTQKISDDEFSLTALEVTNNGKISTLSVTPDTSIFEGDSGYISFTDINFDSFPDIAVSTSFGVTNMYMDYWVYLPDQQKYVSVGNFPKFTVDPANKALSAIVKIDAAKYENNVWKWQESNLVQVKKQSVNPEKIQPSKRAE